MEDLYEARLVQEQDFYRDVIDVRSLPRIAHYWADRHVRPKLEAFGFSTPAAFFKKSLEDLCLRDETRHNNFFSIGSGNCELEVDSAEILADQAIFNFTIECFDLNQTMLERGRELAREKGVLKYLRFTRGDFNSWEPRAEYDAILADQALHHVANLEGLLDAVKRALKTEGLFLASDMIGRNGHLRWPEALEIVQEFWRELPANYRYNHQFGRQEDEYQDWDCSNHGFEGIRSQDIMPALLDRFKFRLFVSFANVIDIFTDRAFGHNFDPKKEWDRSFIDRVHERDEAEMRSGRIKPTHMIAIMSKVVRHPIQCHLPFTPEFCTRKP